MARRTPDYSCKLPPFERTDLFSIQEVQQRAGWAITAFHLPDAWKFTEGEDVVVAVLDTGCDLDHEDLKDNLLPGTNFIDPSKPPQDDCGHGSHVTGIMIAEDNNLGIVGVAPRAKVRPVKVLDSTGSGNLLNVVKGIKWAIGQKVDFISMSLGSPMPVQEVQSAVQEAAAAGIVTFCAAGNAGNTDEIYYPAAYKETIAIGAVGESLHRAGFSNTGHNLDFMAPGVDILSTVPKNWYAILSGTSMAAPFACAVAVLVKSYARKHSGNLKLASAQNYRDLFKKHTIPVLNGNYADPHFYEGFGIIDPRTFIESSMRMQARVRAQTTGAKR